MTLTTEKTISIPRGTPTPIATLMAALEAAAGELNDGHATVVVTVSADRKAVRLTVRREDAAPSE